MGLGRSFGIEPCDLDAVGGDGGEEHDVVLLVHGVFHLHEELVARA